MSRWKKLNDWPHYLQRMSLPQLREELASWQTHLERLRHPDARKEVEARMRKVRKVLEEKRDEGSGEPPGTSEDGSG